MDIENNVLRWVDNVIIGKNICPFAKDDWDPRFYRLCVKNHNLLDDKNAGDLFDEIDSFKSELIQGIHSKIVIYPFINNSFIEFYDFCEHGVDFIHSQNLQNEIQLVCFHPHFYFDEENLPSACHYANRSPYPLIHFLSYSRVSEIVDRLGEDIGAKVSNNNSTYLQNLTIDEFQANIGQYIDGFWPIKG